LSDLVDTTEMYLRTIYELGEEGIIPLRARIAERLNQSGPTVSQTVARMQRDGLVGVADDRHLELTELGRQRAVRVMRKHRLAERLLVDVIGLDLSLVHDEACRWEHVMSLDVERRLVELLNYPTESPYGTPIPGLEEIVDSPPQIPDFQDGVAPLTDIADEDLRTVLIRRLAEPLQHVETLSSFTGAHALPGRTVEVRRDADTIHLASGGVSLELSAEDASHVFVSTAAP
jgi:DtxR family Mn-dependent transcriptional regulator